jgi:GMP synthase-like glutamine amidotransferase
MTARAVKTVLSLDLEPRLDGPDFRGPQLFPDEVPVTVVKAELDGVPPSAAPFSHLVLSGSTHSILDDHSPTHPAMALVRDAVERGVPVMGVCYGHQLIVRALLGQAHVRRSSTPEFGWLPVHWTGDANSWFRGLPNPFRVFVGHFDEVIDLPPGWQVLARTHACGVHAYVQPALRVFGVQFHPEMDLATGNTCFALDAPALAAAGADVARIVADAAEDGSGHVLFRRFLRRRWYGA